MGVFGMDGPCESCPHERVHEVEFRLLHESLQEVKNRVTRVELTLARGVMLLVANLVGVVMSLVRGFLQT